MTGNSLAFLVPLFIIGESGSRYSLLYACMRDMSAQVYPVVCLHGKMSAEVQPVVCLREGHVSTGTACCMLHEGNVSTGITWCMLA